MRIWEAKPGIQQATMERWATGRTLQECWKQPLLNCFLLNFSTDPIWSNFTFSSFHLTISTYFHISIFLLIYSYILYIFSMHHPIQYISAGFLMGPSGRVCLQVFTVWNMASTTALSVLKRGYCACKESEGGTFSEFFFFFFFGFWIENLHILHAFWRRW